MKPGEYLYNAYSFMWTPSHPRALVAQMFLVVSLLMGIPSALLFVFSAWGSIDLHFSAPPQPGPEAPIGHPIFDALTACARFIAKAFSFLGNAAEWALTALAVASLVLTALAVLLFLISRGLHAARTWARIVGIAVALAPLVTSLLIMTSFRRPLPLVLGAGGALLSGYTIWVLAWRFPA
jgi:hypothetical protein